MKERLLELKNKATEKANYFSNISFDTLSKDYTEFANFLSEIEEIIKENEVLKAQIQILEEKIQSQKAVIRATREESEDD